LAARVYRKQLRILDGRGVLFGVADDVRILGPPEVITEMAKGFPTLTWEEAGLTIQKTKNESLCSPTPKPTDAASSI
jgi:hypothetical protein